MLGVPELFPEFVGLVDFGGVTAADGRSGGRPLLHPLSGGGINGNKDVLQLDRKESAEVTTSGVC